MTERHDLCRPSFLISKDEDIAERINHKVKESDEAEDLLDLEKKAERDIIFERENTLMLELEAMKKKQRQLVEINFCGKEWLLERCEKRITKEGY